MMLGFLGSLPLMGIENPCLEVVNPLHQAELITPHGDRKHVGGQPVHDLGTLLITPHGDRKP